MAESGVVHVAMILTPSARGGADISRVSEIATSLGMKQTACGKATLSFRVALDDFERLFGVRPTEVKSSRPNERGFGAPAGFTTDEPLEIPEALRPFVTAITVTPPAERLS